MSEVSPPSRAAGAVGPLGPRALRAGPPRHSVYTSAATGLIRMCVARRRALGLSQKVLARNIGTSTSLIAKIETEQTVVSLHRFIVYAAACGVTLAPIAVDPQDSPWPRARESRRRRA